MAHILRTTFILILLSGGLGSANGQEKLESVYSNLASSSCKTIELDKETSASTQSCRGIAGYKLLVHDDDSRQSITVVTPDGKKHDLDFWQVITNHFSSVGNKAEWRVIRKKGKLSPVALIVRVNASEDPANPTRTTSYLAVAKLTADKICVTNKIGPGANANTDARRAADSASKVNCLPEIGSVGNAPE